MCVVRRRGGGSVVVLVRDVNAVRLFVVSLGCVLSTVKICRSNSWNVEVGYGVITFQTVVLRGGFLAACPARSDDNFVR